MTRRSIILYCLPTLITQGQLFEGTGMSFFQACIMYYITELMGILEEQSIIIMVTSIAGAAGFYADFLRNCK